MEPGAAFQLAGLVSSSSAVRANFSRYSGIRVHMAQSRICAASVRILMT